MSSKNANTAIGSNFDQFLADQGLFENSTAVAIERVTAWRSQKPPPQEIKGAKGCID